MVFSSPEIVYEEDVGKNGSSYIESRQIPRTECKQVAKQVGHPIFPPLPPIIAGLIAVDEEFTDEIDCPIGCECVDFASCKGIEFEELFRKSGNKQKFQSQLCGMIPPKVCCCSQSSKLKSFIWKHTVWTINDNFLKDWFW